MQHLPQALNQPKFHECLHKVQTCHAHYLRVVRTVLSVGPATALTWDSRSKEA